MPTKTLIVLAVEDEIHSRGMSIADLAFDIRIRPGTLIEAMRRGRLSSKLAEQVMRELDLVVCPRAQMGARPKTKKKRPTKSGRS